jgi:AbrB family looped-hinge helix DNA binding protein
MRITSKGQVTIPQEIRERTGLLPNTEVEFVLEEYGVRIVKVRDARRPTRGAKAVEALRRGGGRGQHVDRRDHGTHARRVVSLVLVDSNLLLDVVIDDLALGAASVARPFPTSTSAHMRRSLATGC